MINIVHPRIDAKPPIKKVHPVKKVEVKGNGLEGIFHENEMKIYSENGSAEPRSAGNMADEGFDLKNIRDENRNLIPAGSSIFDQLYDMINDLERNSTNGIPPRDESALRKTTVNDERSDKAFDSQLRRRTDFMKSKQDSNGSSFHDILSFLEKFEDGCFNDLKTNKSEFDPFKNSEGMFISEQNVTSLKTNRYESAENHMVDALRADLATMRLQVEEKEATVRMLADQLKTERKSACEKMESQRKMQASKAEQRENEHRNVVKRHQKFIEQLLAEKSDLTEKCNSLTQRVKEVEAKASRDLKVLAERQSVELQRTKELCAASEKIRRERWLQAKTSKIKEMTVKGLEPEMRSMVEQHQRELQDLKGMHIKELQETELRVVRQYSQQLEQLRIDLTATHEKTLTNEREILCNRYKEKLEEQEAQFRMQQTRYKEKFEEQESQFRAQEKRFTEELAKERANFEREKSRREAERDSAIEEMRTEFQKQTDALKERHESKMKALRDSLEGEWQTLFKNHQRQQHEKFRQAEETIKKECEKERDKLVELAIKRLERETRDSKVKLQQNFNDTIRKLKEKYETELKTAIDTSESRKVELSMKEKQLGEIESRLRDTEAKLNECQSNLTNTNELVKQLSTERDNAKKLARQEIEFEKKELQDKIGSLYEELSKNNSNTEVLMAQLHSRIKLVITQKVLTIKNLTRELNDCKARCEHLEQLLDQQRKEFILKSL